MNGNSGSSLSWDDDDDESQTSPAKAGRLTFKLKKSGGLSVRPTHSFAGMNSSLTDMQEIENDSKLYHDFARKPVKELNLVSSASLLEIFKELVRMKHDAQRRVKAYESALAPLLEAQEESMETQEWYISAKSKITAMTKIEDAVELEALCNNLAAHEVEFEGTASRRKSRRAATPSVDMSDDDSDTPLILSTTKKKRAKISFDEDDESEHIPKRSKSSHDTYEEKAVAPTKTKFATPQEFYEYLQNYFTFPSEQLCQLLTQHEQRSRYAFIVNNLGESLEQTEEHEEAKKKKTKKKPNKKVIKKPPPPPIDPKLRKLISEQEKSIGCPEVLQKHSFYQRLVGALIYAPKVKGDKSDASVRSEPIFKSNEHLEAIPYCPKMKVDDKIKLELESIGLSTTDFSSEVAFHERQDDDLCEALRVQQAKLQAELDNNRTIRIALREKIRYGAHNNSLVKQHETMEALLEKTYEKVTGKKTKQSTNQEKRLSVTKKALEQWRVSRRDVGCEKRSVVGYFPDRSQLTGFPRSLLSLYPPSPQNYSFDKPFTDQQVKREQQRSEKSEGASPSRTRVGTIPSFSLKIGVGGEFSNGLGGKGHYNTPSRDVSLGGPIETEAFAYYKGRSNPKTPRDVNGRFTSSSKTSVGSHSSASGKKS